MDHETDDPSSFCLVLSASRASVPLRQRACLCSGCSYPSGGFSGCVRECERVGEGKCVSCCVELRLHEFVCFIWFMSVCVGACVYTCSHSHGLCLGFTQREFKARGSCNTFCTFNTISKLQYTPHLISWSQRILRWKIRNQLRNVFLKCFSDTPRKHNEKARTANVFGRAILKSVVCTKRQRNRSWICLVNLFISKFT